MRLLCLLFLLTACATTEPEPAAPGQSATGPRYSLGQWSYHAPLFAGEMDTYDFVRTAGELGFDGVELVNQFFLDQAGNTAYLDSLRQVADAADVALTMLLVDRAGSLASPDEAERAEAVRQHLAWVDATARLGITDMRVNAHGEGTPEEVMEAAVSGVGELATRAREKGVRILIENHGGISSNGAWLKELLDRLAPQGVGAVADFDNWCYRRSDGSMYGGECSARYDRYQGVLELMPYAGGVSVKAFTFDAEGNEPDMDYDVLFDIIRGADYDGYLGIEYEGDGLPPREGILKTRALAERAWPRRQVVTDGARTRIDSILSGFVADGKVAGVSALVYEKGEEVYYGAYGDADRNAGTGMDRNTIAQIYSMTKPITGVALMQLYEQGKFRLDDPLADHLPEFAGLRVYDPNSTAGDLRTVGTERPVTVRDITRHTAGFYTGGDAPGLQEAFTSAGLSGYDHTLSEQAEKLGGLPLIFQPGTQWLYGPSVDIQALLVERLSGQAFDEYLREHVLGPLGMEDTRYFVPEADRSRLTSAYLCGDDGTLSQLPNDQAHDFNINPYPLTPGGFGLTSTLDDYMTFARMLVNEGTFEGTTLLQPETVRLMRTNQLSDTITERLWLPSKGQVGFGIDFAVRMRPPATAEEAPGAVGEFFWDGAASTLFWVDPANDLTAVLFVQLFPFDQVGLHRGFREGVYGGR